MGGKVNRSAILKTHKSDIGSITIRLNDEAVKIVDSNPMAKCRHEVFLYFYFFSLREVYHAMKSNVK